MAALSTRETIPVPLESPAGRVTYHLRVASLIERRLIMRDVRALGVTVVRREDVVEALREDVRRYVVPEQHDLLLALLDEAEADPVALDAPSRADDAATLSELREAMSRRASAYASALADQTVFVDVAGLLALKRLLVGVDGPVDPPVRVNDEVTDDWLQRLPDGHLMALPLVAISSLFMSESDRKNWQSSPTSAVTPTPTPAAAAPRTDSGAGMSAGTSSPKTRRTRSTRTGGS